MEKNEEKKGGCLIGVIGIVIIILLSGGNPFGEVSSYLSGVRYDSDVDSVKALLAEVVEENTEKEVKETVWYISYSEYGNYSTFTVKFGWYDSKRYEIVPESNFAKAVLKNVYNSISLEEAKLNIWDESNPRPVIKEGKIYW